LLFSYTHSLSEICEETWYGVAQNMCASVLRSAGKEERGLKLI
jgi:hypothetical protein